MISKIFTSAFRILRESTRTSLVKLLLDSLLSQYLPDDVSSDKRNIPQQILGNMIDRVSFSRSCKDDFVGILFTDIRDAKDFARALHNISASFSNPSAAKLCCVILLLCRLSHERVFQRSKYLDVQTEALEYLCIVLSRLSPEKLGKDYKMLIVVKRVVLPMIASNVTSLHKKSLEFSLLLLTAIWKRHYQILFVRVFLRFHLTIPERSWSHHSSSSSLSSEESKDTNFCIDLLCRFDSSSIRESREYGSNLLQL